MAKGGPVCEQWFKSITEDGGTALFTLVLDGGLFGLPLDSPIFRIERASEQLSFRLFIFVYPSSVLLQQGKRSSN